MLQHQSSRICYLRIIGVLVAWGVFPTASLAQITPDGSLGGAGSQVTPGATTGGQPANLIEGGAQRGANLFHSFSDFNVGNLQRVYFANPAGVQNILSRVTGTNPSNILGTLGVNGAANLFLLNPNGIIFGPNARLDLRGSFVASTADSLKFDNGFAFSASNPQAPPLLTINVPIGLQFGANPGGIRVQGRLQVGTGQTLALVGGEVVLAGGTLTAAGGRIELGSVAAGSLVAMTSTNPGWELSYPAVQQFQDIRLTQAARVDASGDGGGSIQVQGQRLTLTEGSQIVTLTQGTQAGKNLTVRAVESVEVTGSDSRTGSSSALAAQANRGSGNAGNLTIETGKLRIADGAQVSVSTFSAGKGGDLTVRAQSVEVNGSDPVDGSSSFLAAQANPGSTGNAGNLTIDTGSLRIAAGAQVSASTFGAGNGGDLTVRAQSVEVNGSNSVNGSSSVLNAQANRGSTGNAGEITLITDRLHIANRGQIRATSLGAGSAGNITVQAASQITLADNARISSNTNAGQGNITLNMPLLLLRRNSSITTNATGTATGGNITIAADFIVSAPHENNDIIANAFAGSGGKITLSAQNLFWFDLRTRQDLQRLLNTTNPAELDPRRLPTNDITAFSQANPTIDTGAVTVQTLDLDPTRGLTALPTDFTDRSQLIAATCAADKGSSFTITGRGGLPEDPRQPLMGGVIWRDDRGAGETGRGQEVTPSKSAGAIVEAQGWIVDRSGTVVLVAGQPRSLPQSFSQACLR